MVKASQHDALADGCERLEALHAVMRVRSCTLSLFQWHWGFLMMGNL